jgi:hypothetical protein
LFEALASGELEYRKHGRTTIVLRSAWLKSLNGLRLGGLELKHVKAAIAGQKRALENAQAMKASGDVPA